MRSELILGGDEGRVGVLFDVLVGEHLKAVAVRSFSSSGCPLFCLDLLAVARSFLLCTNRIFGLYKSETFE